MLPRQPPATTDAACSRFEVPKPPRRERSVYLRTLSMSIGVDFFQLPDDKLQLAERRLDLETSRMHNVWKWYREEALTSFSS